MKESPNILVEFTIPYEERERETLENSRERKVRMNDLVGGMEDYTE